MVPPPAYQLTCPKCKRDSTLRQQEAENLTTNAYALNIVQLKKFKYQIFILVKLIKNMFANLKCKQIQQFLVLGVWGHS